MATVTSIRQSTGSTDRIVVVRFDRIYGQWTCYPVNAVAQTICVLTGRKTMTRADLRNVQLLGFCVQLSHNSMISVEDYMNSTPTAGRAEVA